MNISGCFLIGLLAPLALKPEGRLFLMVGLCGGYTTFSSFGLQTLDLARDGLVTMEKVRVLQYAGNPDQL